MTTDHRTVVEFVDDGPNHLHKTSEVRINGSPVTVATGGISVTNPSGENPLRVMLTLLPDELHYVHDAETPPSSAPAAPVSDDPAPDAPVDPQGATGPQEGTGRIGWLRPTPSCRFRYLAREVECGWSDKDHDAPEWTVAHYPDAVFTPLAGTREEATR